MSYNKKRFLITTGSVILALIIFLAIYWIVIRFNPIQWCIDNANIFIMCAVATLVGILIVISIVLGNRYNSNRGL